VNGQKQGGNVASYFCLADGTVIHAVAGPVDAATFLREARWAVDLRKLAITQSDGDVAKYRATVRRGHLERLSAEHGVNMNTLRMPRLGPGAPPEPQREVIQSRNVARLNGAGQVHLLLAYYPLPKLEQLYPIVFENVLGEKVSTLPVVTK
jgi:hypothetical protein